jgi:crotonobetaine/carnitine-CoA ligase
MHLREFLESKVALCAEKPYLFFEDQAWTYRQFDNRVNQAANAFLELGVQKGQRVCLMLPNHPGFLFAWLGLNKIGAVMVPINTGFKGREVAYIVEHCGARGIVASPETFPVATAVRGRSETLNWVAVIGGSPDGDTVHLGRRWDRCATKLAATRLDDQDTASIIYTSGTTGPPKGVMHAQRAYVLGGQAMTARSDLSSRDRLMIILPLFHANAQFYSTMGSLAAEASLILTPRFSASKFWRQAKRFEATQFSFIGAIGRILTARPKEEFEPDHCIRVANGGPVPPDVYTAFVERFKIPYVIDGYGLTECPCVCHNPIYGTKKSGSMGLPARHPEASIQFTQMKVVDDQDRELGPDQVGELVLQSPLLMKGYWNDPQGTARAMRGGWFHTGDYVYRDKDGYYFFVDRKKDIIRRRGENISSAEVEGVLNTHPKVRESAVVPVAAALGEDEIKAFIVVKENETLHPQEVLSWCKERLADFKVPRYLELKDALPRTPSQRIAKYLLSRQSSGEDVVDLTGVGPI